MTEADEELRVRNLYSELERLVPPLLFSRVLSVVRELASGARGPQCRATWPEQPTPESGYAACQLRGGHTALHARADGARWADGGELQLVPEEDWEADEQAGFWLVHQLGAEDPQVTEHAARIMTRYRRIRPERGDDVEAWLKRHRDDSSSDNPWYWALDSLLEEWRERSDYGLMLTENLVEP